MACPKDKILDLDGRGPSSHPLIISKLILLETDEVDVPTAATLKSVADDSAVENSALSRRTPPIMNQSILMILPPFLENNIIKL